MANLLVTGGAGFIGGNFIHYRAQQHPGDSLIVLDCLTYAGNASTIAGVEQAELVEADIRDTDLVEELLREREIDAIVHLAAESHVDRSISGPDA
ncbi:MAG: GDP-mannose 4,6-dehydratase, partial [Alteraurantiacibacter sp.]